MLNIENHTSYELDEEGFVRAFNLFCDEENIDRKKEVNLLFETGPEMQALNRRYRGVDRNTDVLSFGYDQPDLPILGDIVIDIAWADSRKSERSLQDELEYLFLHGLLHLAGYDHGSRSTREEMDRKHQIIWNKMKE